MADEPASDERSGSDRAAGGRRYPVTPDGRYFVVRGRLWRRSNPDLPEECRTELVRALMEARRRVRSAKGLGEDGRDALAEARTMVDAAKTALGERGAVWWDDGAPDENRRLVRNTAYAAWFAVLPEGDG